VSDVVAAVAWTGLTLYAVFGGADFGAGSWDLLARRSPQRAPARRLINFAIGPVWEANHVWLIFVLVVMWTGFPAAFAAIMSTLFIPLALAALGIVLRGSAFALRRPVAGRGERVATLAFGISSLLTPLFLGAALGGIASGRVPAGNAAGDAVTSWVNPTSAVVGVLAVAVSAYLAAVFLVADARRIGDERLERYFALRAFAAAGLAGVVAAGGLVVLSFDADYVFDRLVREALPLVLASVACGIANLVVLGRGGRFGTRALAVGAVAAVVWAWGLAQHPYLLPKTLTIGAAASSHTTLVWLVAIVACALLIVVPALALLYTLDQRSLLEESPLTEG
jgi:cytochrome d ubiquinol oxidase subunit II